MLSEEKEFSLHMKNISKSFPGVKALDDVSLLVKKGEVHALMGENGAGKSTLMKILAGIQKPDSGEIIVNGNKINLNSPKDALQHGISMIHQELSYIPGLSVAENIFLGREFCYKRTGVVLRKQLRLETRKLFEQFNINDIHEDALMSSLTVAQIQMVEILKAISYQADIIVMDEPTSAITEREVEKLYSIIKTLTNQGKSIIYISHKMNEINDITDRVTVLRDGCYIGTKKTKELTESSLISMMVGRELTDIYIKNHTPEIGEVLLEVKNLTKKGEYKNINLQLRRGEVLGIAGLMGAGRTELVESIFGKTIPDNGEIFIKQEKIKIRSPRMAIKSGIALVSEDRKKFGLNLKASVRENMTLSNLADFCFGKSVIEKNTEKRVVKEQIQNLNIKTPSQEAIVNNLSGGNQQKVVLAKWLLTNPDILILDEPTRGIDVGAKSEIYDIITSLAKKGKAIIMISSEMRELLGVSDRVLAMYKGEIKGEFAKHEFDQENILACCTGHEKGAVIA